MAPLLNKAACAMRNGKKASLGPVKPFRGLAFFDTHFKKREFSISGMLRLSVLRDHTDLIMMGDVHGDFLAFLSVLRSSGFVDDDANYVPPPSERVRRVVVALGDVLDRGGRGSVTRDTAEWPEEELAMLEYAWHVDKLARKHGERLLLLAGNHELRALQGNDDHTSEATAMPFGQRRSQVFKRPGIVRYFMSQRPIMAVTDDGWLMAHGDFQPKPIGRFLVREKEMLNALRLEGDLRTYEALCVAVNTTWSAWVLRHEDENAIQRMRGWAKGGKNPYAEALGRKTLPELPMSVLFGRTLAGFGELDCGRTTPACKRSVGRLQKMLGLDWTVSGGIGLGHTVQAHLSDACEKAVYLNDVGMSEGFFGVNGSPVAFVVADRRERVAQVENSEITIAREREAAV